MCGMSSVQQIRDGHDQKRSNPRNHPYYQPVPAHPGHRSIERVYKPIIQFFHALPPPSSIIPLFPCLLQFLPESLRLVPVPHIDPPTPALHPRAVAISLSEIEYIRCKPQAAGSIGNSEQSLALTTPPHCASLRVLLLRRICHAFAPERAARKPPGICYITDLLVFSTHTAARTTASQQVPGTRYRVCLCILPSCSSRI